MPEAEYDDALPGSLFFEGGVGVESAVDDAAGMNHEEDVVAEPAETGPGRR